MRQVRFSRLVMSPVYGNCDVGDIVRCDDAFAQHVVVDLGVAEFVDTPAPALDEATAQPAVRRGRRSKQGGTNA